MKKKKFIQVIAILFIVSFSAFNVQTIFADDPIEHDGGDGSCGGAECAQANGNKYYTCSIGNEVVCCGVAHEESGKQK